MPRLSRERMRFGLLVGLLLALLGLFVWAVGSGVLTEERLASWVEAGGAWSPLLFVVIATLAPLAWVPRMMTSIVAGALFGLWFGAALALAGGTGGALASYWLGKKLGHDFVMARIGPKGKRIADFLARRGFVAISLGRISPVTNCAAISLGSGLLGVPMRVYIPSTIVGMAPGALLYAAFGAAVLDQDGWNTTASVIVAVVLAVLTGWWLWAMWKKDRAEMAAQAAPAPALQPDH